MDLLRVVCLVQEYLVIQGEKMSYIVFVSQLTLEQLKLRRNAIQSDIKKAYLDLAKVYHPDRNKAPNANEQFNKIQE